jgi:hypothetical protein
MATMFFQKVLISEHIQFISVVESKASAEIFVSLASTTNPTVCQAWLKDVSKKSQLLHAFCYPIINQYNRSFSVFPFPPIAIDQAHSFICQ